MADDDDDDSTSEWSWGVAVPLIAAVCVLIFSHFAMRHWVACGIAGLAVLFYFRDHRARSYRKAMLGSLLIGGAVLGLLAWFTPPGAMRSLNHLNSLDDESWIAFTAIGAGIFFAGGLLMLAGQGVRVVLEEMGWRKRR